jgi:uncharacterized membrane protein
VTISKRLAGKGAILSFAVVFFGICTWVSYARWANFEYRTFDLAYYVQALWQLIHGRFDVSVEGVPLLGNHVEPIVFLMAPFFLLFRHPLVFVCLQNVMLATMGPVAFRIACRLGFDRRSALFLAAAILITPATGYIALHEFHPEALSAPFLLLMIEARLAGSVRSHWVWLIAVLACKENMALLITAYCLVHLVAERERRFADLRAWYVWPLVLSISWFLLCTKLITPVLNSGSIDYLSLYDRLGASMGEILLNAFLQPQRILQALFQSLTHGNLIWGLLLPFLGLPLVRPRWLLIASPVLLQHLLSWRSSEWTIYFHYAAPLLPLFWFAMAEATIRLDQSRFAPGPIRRSLPAVVLVACVAAQIASGPARDIITETRSWPSGGRERARKQAFINQVPPSASVLAPLPYLSHLAMRQQLYSLHYVLKGLKTLSRVPYDPPLPTDYVLIDYGDSATFDPGAGYYHPAMKTVDGRIIPSSDHLLHDFLSRSSWQVNSSDELTLLRRNDRSEVTEAPAGNDGIQMGNRTFLTNIAKSGEVLSSATPIEINLNWNFPRDRDVFPWMFLKLVQEGNPTSVTFVKGLCAPEAGAGSYQEKWRFTCFERLATGEYVMEAIFVDNSRRAWSQARGQVDAEGTMLSNPIPLGHLRVSGAKSPRD